MGGMDVSPQEMNAFADLLTWDAIVVFSEQRSSREPHPEGLQEHSSNPGKLCLCYNVMNWAFGKL